MNVLKKHLSLFKVSGRKLYFNNPTFLNFLDYTHEISFPPSSYHEYDFFKVRRCDVDLTDFLFCVFVLPNQYYENNKEKAEDYLNNLIVRYKKSNFFNLAFFNTTDDLILLVKKINRSSILGVISNYF